MSYAKFVRTIMLKEAYNGPMQKVRRSVNVTNQSLQGAMELGRFAKTQGRGMAMNVGSGMISAGKTTGIKPMVGMGKDIYTAGAGRKGYLGHGKFLPNRWQRKFRKLTA
jgi:hypothetical protein